MEREVLRVVRQFRSVKDSLGSIDAETTARLITAAADVALVLDKDGIIRDLAFDRADLDLEGADGWLGKPWIDTVTIESRAKVLELLSEAAAGAATPSWREINHPSSRTADVPLLYAAAEVSDDGRLVVIGRDLRAVATLQQRLVDAQQSMERDYSRMRHAETRYRLLFQTSSDAVMIVDTVDQKIKEINPTAARLIAASAESMIGQRFNVAFAKKSRAAIADMFATVRATGRSDDVILPLAEKRGEVRLNASLFRQNQATLFLVRLAPASGDPAAAVLPLAKHKILKLVESAPDGLLVTDADARIITANSAFLDLVEMTAEDQVRGQSLDRWLGRPGVDLRVLVSSLRDHGSIRLFATTIRGEYGASSDVEVSAVTLKNGDKPCLGFAIRHVGQRLSSTPSKLKSVPRSMDKVTELVGRVPLKELVREATDVIEKLCIEAALELTGDNRASAAEMLGLSRQSLYVKLRRYGMAEVATDNGGR